MTAVPAEAYRLAGKRWPGKVIAYAVDAPLYEQAVDDAARAWNRSRVGIRFERASLARARLVIRSGASRGAGLSGCEGENGRAMLGWPGAWYAYSVIGFVGSCGSRRNRRLIAMHELGHALGLDHENRRCAVMNSSLRVRAGMPRRCRGRRAAARLRHGPLPDDVRGARRLYSTPSPTTIGAARFAPDTTRPAPGRPVAFRARLRNSRLVYRWDFGDPWSGFANYAVGHHVEHAFTAPGAYDVTLSVVDGEGVISRRTQRVVSSP